jgi:hypothetical protein
MASMRLRALRRLASEPLIEIARLSIATVRVQVYYRYLQVPAQPCIYRLLRWRD